MRLISSPLRYPGGKSKVVKFLAKFFPEFKELREPMCGGASITLYWVQIKPSARYIISDINYDLYCFWKELKYSADKLIREVRLIKKSYKDGRKLFEELMQSRDEPKDDLRRAVEFFVLNRITFSGTVDSGGYSESAFKKRFTDSSIERLEKVSELLSKVEVYHDDYENFLSVGGKDVVIFLDPPYYSSKASRLYGKRGNLHLSFDHLRLFQNVKKTTHKVLITYDNSPYIRELYKDFYILEWRLKYGMTNYCKDYLREGEELLIANFPLNKALQNLRISNFSLETNNTFY
jgi:DNA adenine methylase